MKRSKSPENLIIEQLESWAHGRPLRAGQEIKGSVELDGLEVEIVATVKRKVERADIPRLRDAALEHLAANLELVHHCGCWLKSSSGSCDAKITAAIVTRRLAYDLEGKSTENFRFVCNRHRENHGLDPAYVIATIELPPSSYAAILAKAVAARAKRDAEFKLESDTRSLIEDVFRRRRREVRQSPRLVDVDSLVQTDGQQLRPGHQIEIERNGTWARAKVLEIRGGEALGLRLDSGAPVVADLNRVRWRSTERVPAIVSGAVAMEVLRFGQEIDVRVPDEKGRPGREWKCVLVDAFLETGFAWKAPEHEGVVEVGFQPVLEDHPSASGDPFSVDWRFHSQAELTAAERAERARREAACRAGDTGPSASPRKRVP
jgi:hypothetical protein